MKIDSYSKDIAAAATAENLVADSGGDQFKYARQVLVRCPSANTSDLLIGNNKRQAFTIAKGTTHVFPVGNGPGGTGKYDLSQMYVKAGTNADDVEIILIDPSND